MHKLNLQYVVRKMKKWKQPESCVNSILQRKCVGHIVVPLHAEDRHAFLSLITDRVRTCLFYYIIY